MHGRLSHVSEAGSWRVAALIALASAFGCRSETTPPRRESTTRSAPLPPLHTIRARAEGQLGPGRGVVLIDLEAPDGAKLNQEAPVSARAEGGIGLTFPEGISGPLSGHEMPLRLPVDVQDGATGPTELQLSYYWCANDAPRAACQRETATIHLSLDLSGDAAGGEAYLAYRTGAP